ncbi:hypothetical protein [Micromonospora sp. NPDC005652]|uniref:hypothetical protein n=1 Tax=Micromonospora sp. NPDC005652 TaxID=3157046 RepID=UPI0033DBF2BF
MINKILWLYAGLGAYALAMAALIQWGLNNAPAEREWAVVLAGALAASFGGGATAMILRRRLS